MALVTDSAVVLRRLDYSETSQIIVLMTRDHGKVRAIAKGIKRGTKKRFATGMDLFDIGTAGINAKEERSESLALLTEWKQTRALSGLREALHRLHGAQYAVEITGGLTEDWDPHPELFDALILALTELADSDEPFESLASYQRRLLESIGSLPRFDACVLCGRLDELTHFSSFEGGMICRTCEPEQAEKHEVSKPTWAALAGRAEPASHVGPFSLMNYHIAHMLGKQPLLAGKLLSGHRRANGTPPDAARP